MKGLSTAIVAMIFVMVTVIAMLGVFSLYLFYFSNESNSIFSQSNLIGISRLIQLQISSLTFYGISPNYNYFNVSYLIWVNSPTKTVTLIIFNETPAPPSLLSYTLPPSNAKSGLFKSQPQGYVSLKNFTLNSNVYSPTGELLGLVNTKAYNISSNSSYILSSIINPYNIIDIWILYYYQGKWYRLAWTYVAPANQGLGLYTLTNSGIYGSSNPNDAIPPHYVTSQKGIMFGVWFKMLNTQANSLISNLSISTVNNNNVSFIIYTKNGGLYINITKNHVTIYTTIILQKLNQGMRYFLNMSFGAQVNQEISIDVYSANQRLLNSITIPQTQLSSLNGYLSRVKFGSPLLTTAVSQAFIVSLQSTSGITRFYNVSQTVLENGYYYNNTNNLKQIIANSNNQLYSIIYWNFVWAYSNPPPNVPAIMWYWPSGNAPLATTYIYPVGQNTYSIS